MICLYTYIYYANIFTKNLHIKIVPIKSMNLSLSFLPFSINETQHHVPKYELVISKLLFHQELLSNIIDIISILEFYYFEHEKQRQYTIYLSTISRVCEYVGYVYMKRFICQTSIIRFSLQFSQLHF